MNKLELTGRHLELTPELRSYTEEKFSKLGRLMHELDIHVTLSVEKHRRTCAIVAEGNGATYTAEVTDEDMYKAINESVDVLQRQIRKDKTARLADRREGAETIRRQD